MRDPAFGADRAGLSQALDALIAARGGTATPAGGLADLHHVGDREPSARPQNAMRLLAHLPHELR